jgi:hypothetical protein
MVFEQEVYVGDSELSPASAPNSTPNVLISKRDSAGGSFEGGLCGRNDTGGAGVGEDGGGAYPDGGGRCQHVTTRQWRLREWGGASA